MARKYSPKAQEEVQEAMHEMKEGELEIGTSGKKVKSRKQAIAIGLSQARKKGANVPQKKTATKKSISKKTATKKKSAPKKATSKKKAAPKKAAKKRR